MYYFFFASFQWAVGRIWYWSTSNIENCSLFRGRILLSNTNLLCFDWLWHRFAICRKRETNCVASLGMLLWSNGDISEVCFCVGLFIRKKYIYKFHKIFLIRNYWKWKGCRITQNNDTIWKSFEFRQTTEKKVLRNFTYFEGIIKYDWCLVL